MFIKIKFTIDTHTKDIYFLYKRKVNALVRPACLPVYFHRLNHGFHDDVIKWKHFLRYWPFVRAFCAGNSPGRGEFPS